VRFSIDYHRVLFVTGIVEMSEPTTYNTLERKTIRLYDQGKLDADTLRAILEPWYGADLDDEVDFELRARDGRDFESIMVHFLATPAEKKALDIAGHFYAPVAEKIDRNENARREFGESMALEFGADTREWRERVQEFLDPFELSEMEAEIEAVFEDISGCLADRILFGVKDPDFADKAVAETEEHLQDAVDDAPGSLDAEFGIPYSVDELVEMLAIPEMVEAFEDALGDMEPGPR